MNNFYLTLLYSKCIQFHRNMKLDTFEILRVALQQLYIRLFKLKINNSIVSITKNKTEKANQLGWKKTSTREPSPPIKKRIPYNLKNDAVFGDVSLPVLVRSTEALPV